MVTTRLVSDVLLDPSAVALSLTRMAAEIVERGRRLGSGGQGGAPALVLIGIRRGGDPLAKRIAEKIAALGGSPGVHVGAAAAPAIGAVDITLYRDDAATALPSPKIGPSKIPVALEGKRVVLVDDVLHTGRTIRAALDAVLDFGRPKIIELACLVDRGGRELPIQPDYVGLALQVGPAERVELVWKRTGPGTDEEEPWAIRVPAPRPSSSRREPT